MPLSFRNLASALSLIKSNYTGASGVYLLMNLVNPGRFYIGSSVNLGRRMTEYHDLTTGSRTPKSNSEREIANTPAEQ